MNIVSQTWLANPIYALKLAGLILLIYETQSLEDYCQVFSIHVFL